MRRAALLSALFVSLSVPLAAGCGSDRAPSATSPADAEQVADGSVVPAGAIVIDVRTTEEFAAGHLEGAVNLNVEDGTLTAQLGELDPNGSYIVYCRSGRRSAIAAEQMVAAGFTDVTDLGGIDEAARETGLPVVTG